MKTVQLSEEDLLLILDILEFAKGWLDPAGEKHKRVCELWERLTDIHEDR